MAGNTVSANSINAFDIIIVGGGLVGASLAVALEPTGCSVALIEEHEPSGDSQPSFDERTVALTYGSRQIFEGIGIWPAVQETRPQAIRDIHVSERGHSGQIHLSHRHIGTDALGYVVPARVLGNALWAKINHCRHIHVFCPASAASIEASQDDAGQRNICIKSKAETRTLSARLIVLADGGRSPLSRSAGRGSVSRPYSQSAILSIVSTDRNHRGRAYERFTREGPIALLPHSPESTDTGENFRYATVWTSHSENIGERMQLDDEGFAAALQKAFGDRAGQFGHPSPRTCYPLTRSWLKSPIDSRLCIIGNAAHTVHPVAGQGFNLGLRDVAVLAELIHDCRAHDTGGTSLLANYQAQRAAETRRVLRFTDGLIYIFGTTVSPLRSLAGIGLGLIEHCPPCKRFLLKRTVGLHARESKLSFGIPLDGQLHRPQSGG